MVKKILFELLRNEIYGLKLTVEKKDFSDQIFRALFKISKSHDLAHLISDALYKNGLFPIEDETYKPFLKQHQLAVYRNEKLQYELNEISDLFESSGIEFIPLKGAVLRNYYPETWMRTSCDIDVLIKEEDIEKATNALVDGHGAEKGNLGEHDVFFTTSSGVSLELHYKLSEYGKQSDDLLKLIWQDAKPVSDKIYKKEISNELFYYYHIMHMAKHFEIGGCGIRPFIDLSVMLKSMPVDEAKLNELLNNGGLEKFYQASKKLSSVWLLGEEHDQLSIEIEKYIIRSGVYGNTQNRIAVERREKGSKIGYVFKRIFLPYKTIKLIYPKIEGRRWLTPFYNLRRWFSIVFSGRAKKAVNEFKLNSNLSEEMQTSVKKLINDLELCKSRK